MLDVDVLDDEIRKLEMKDASWGNVERLAALYTVRDHFSMMDDGHPFKRYGQRGQADDWGGNPRGQAEWGGQRSQAGRYRSGMRSQGDVLGALGKMPVEEAWGLLEDHLADMKENDPQGYRELMDAAERGGRR